MVPSGSNDFARRNQTMKVCHLAIAAAMLASPVCVSAQDSQATRQGQAAASVSQTQGAIDQAAAANKYAFIFFWKEDGSQTGRAWAALKPAAAKMADVAVFVSIRITNPTEKAIVDRYDVSRAPMPLVLAIAPSGAITKAFTKKFDEQELRTAFVSPCMERSLKALQSRKLVFVCVVDQADPQAKVAIPKGVEGFKTDKKYGAATEVVVVNARDDKEAGFLRELDVGGQSLPLTVFLAPPGAIIGKFGGETSKETFVAKLVAAQSNPCAGGKCGPGGCGPKKK
jgi:hypothetical protein